MLTFSVSRRISCSSYSARAVATPLLYSIKGEIQIAYKGILEFLGKLRAEYIKKHPHYDVSSIYQGYMDMSYFSLSTKSLKDTLTPSFEDQSLLIETIDQAVEKFVKTISDRL
jgi:hypothetical protein